MAFVVIVATASGIAGAFSMRYNTSVIIQCHTNRNGDIPSHQ